MTDTITGLFSSPPFINQSSELSWSLTLNSQFEISPWQMLPSLLMLGFVASGLGQAWWHKKKSRGYAQKQRHDRKKISLPMIINTPVTQEFSVHTFDISLSGAFLPYEDLKNSSTFTSLVGKRTGIKIGDLVDIRLVTGRFNQFSCQARVVRYNFSDDQMPPKGIGIEFVNLSQRKRRILEALISDKHYQSAA